MPKYTLNLIGNSYHDTIFRLNQSDILPGVTQKIYKTYEKMGGVFNFARTLNYQDSIAINLYSFECKNTRSKISSEIENNKSIQTVKLVQSYVPKSFIMVGQNGVKTTVPYIRDENYIMREISINNITKSDWSHIMYLDKLTFIDSNYIRKVKELSKFVSVDLCSSKPSRHDLLRISKCFEYVDFIFMSEHEYRQFIDYYIHYNGNTDTNKQQAMCVIHTQKYVIVIKLCDLLFCKFDNLDTFIEANTGKNMEVRSVLREINPVGAGDIFAANFIYYKLLFDKWELDSIIKEAIETTLTNLSDNW